MRREKKGLERQKNSNSLLLGVGGGESGGRGLAVSSGPRAPVNSSSGDRQFNLRLQQLVALNALKGGSNG